MRTRPVKKKMKTASEIGKRVKRLRTSRSETQIQFAEHIRIAPSRISEWEADKGKPMAEACLLMGNLAPYPENIWFWEQAGLDLQVNLSATEKELKKRGAAPAPGQIMRVPFMKKTSQGWKATGSELPLPTKLVPNPASTICLSIAQSQIYPFSPGDILFLDQSDNEAETFERFWGQILVVETNYPERPKTLFIGQLKCKANTPNYWVADLIEIGNDFIPRSHYVGMWTIEGDANWDEKEREEMERSRRPEALLNIRRLAPIRILGRVIAWFQPPKPGRK